jgi:hypothetical protein
MHSLPRHSVLIFFLSIYDSHESVWFRARKYQIFIEVLDELEIFIDKKVIFVEKKCPPVCRLPSGI